MPYLTDRLDESNRKRLAQQRLAEDATGVDIPLQDRQNDGIDSRYRFDADAVMAAVRAEILGQDEALEQLQHMLRIVRADISDPRKPLHTALFLGPTGVGKTELVRALARALHGDADAFCRVDMNTLSQEHYAAALTGAPPGYVGSKEGTTLLDQDRIEGSLGKPGIVLFDELEKASDQVLQALLNVFDNGLLTVASGERTYSFRNALIFITSNLGAAKLQAMEEGKGRFPAALFPASGQRRRARLVKRMQAELRRRFTPEFINRLDSITIFNWLQGDVVQAVVDLEIARLNRRLQKHQVRLQLDDSTRRHLVRWGFERQYGARSLRRGIRQHIEAPLAHFLLSEFRTGSATQTLETCLQAGVVSFRAVPG